MLPRCIQKYNSCGGPYHSFYLSAVVLVALVEDMLKYPPPSRQWTSQRGSTVSPSLWKSLLKWPVTRNLVCDIVWCHGPPSSVWNRRPERKRTRVSVFKRQIPTPLPPYTGWMIVHLFSDKCTWFQQSAGNGLLCHWIIIIIIIIIIIHSRKYELLQND